MFPTDQCLLDTRKPTDHSMPNTLDISGYEFFSSGSTGAAHTNAHRMLDSGQMQAGHRMLGNWLSGNAGQGSDWVHLHFHMAVFDLALGDWHSAYRRFMTQVLPVAACSTEALTDAPALLWRLECSAPGSVALPWQYLQRTALSAMQHTTDPFVQVHNLLALAGAGDSVGINRWLQNGSGAERTESGRLVEQFAAALSSLASGSFLEASGLLREILPRMYLLGGSHAQGLLFTQLADWSTRRATVASLEQRYATAA